MKKRIILSLVTIAAVAIGVVGMSAFEAHIINVTAKIENSMSVDTESIEFGTVFPQEAMDYEVELSLSDSFMEEERADDVEYILRQKPKCWSETDQLFGLSRHEGDDFFCVQSDTADDYVALPLLCPFLSKHEISTDGDGENDSGGINAFHGPVSDWTMQDTLDTQVSGRMAKSDQDLDDVWNIDLRVPCFEGHCAQDWANFVWDNNELADPEEYMLPIDLESSLFGCDIWIEVTHISETGDLPVCGNGIKEAGEECDDGNDVDGDGCNTFSAQCQYVCGDGHPDAGEQCDDGNLDPNDGCDENCNI